MNSIKFEDWLNEGEPYKFSILISFPILTGELILSLFCTVLGFSTSIEDVETLLISYPLTYAFPGDTWRVKRDSDGVFPFCVVCDSE